MANYNAQRLAHLLDGARGDFDTLCVRCHDGYTAGAIPEHMHVSADPSSRGHFKPRPRTGHCNDCGAVTTDIDQHRATCAPRPPFWPQAPAGARRDQHG